MRPVRRRLSWLIAISLLLQLSAIATPVVLTAAGFDIEDVCTCPTATHGATCPMHHGKTSDSHESTNRCAIKSAAAPSALALLTFTSSASIVPSAHVLHVSVQSSALHLTGNTGFSSRTELPDSPPPRR